MIDLTKKSGFEALSGDFEIITNRLLSDVELCKLLHYDIKEALSQPELTAEEKANLFETNRIRLIPDLYMGEEIGSFIVITYDNFIPGENPKFLPCVMTVDIVCHTDLWMVDKYGKRVIRPYLMADKVMKQIHEKKFAGIGTAQFMGATSMLVVSDTRYAGVSLKFEMMNHA